MSLSSLEIGKRALRASRVGLDVTSNNIANVNTEGYSRRVAVNSETDPRKSSAGYLGTGVLIDKIKNYREEFFDKDVRRNESSLAGQKIDAEVYKRIEGILSEPSELGIGQSVNDFLNSFENLVLQPENLSLRQNLLNDAKNLSDNFNSAADSLRKLRLGLPQRASDKLEQANALLKEIANLNNEVQKSYSSNGAGSQTYIDRREQKLEELSQLFETHVARDDYGSLNVFINGANVITGSDYSTLKIKEKVNSTTGESRLRLFKVGGGGIETAITAGSGEIGSMINHYNTTLNSNSANGLSIAKELNDFAGALASQINSFATQGYGMNDGAAGAPPQRNLFAFNSDAAAATIKVSAAVAGMPEAVPLSSAPGESGNSEIARKISGIYNDKSFMKGMTPSEYYSDLIGKLGQRSSDAQNGEEAISLTLEQLKNQRESVIGVNLDEEAINLIKFQKAFEASSRVVSVTSNILATLVNLGR